MLRINKKEDIIIPFNKIGEDGWEVNTELILKSKAAIWNAGLEDPISASQLQLVESRLETLLPEELKTFYLKFGLAEIGEQLQGLNEIDWIKNLWSKPEYGPDFSKKDLTLLPFLVSFSDYLGNGNMFCFHSETKEIYYYDHDTTPYLSKMFDTVGDYIKYCLVFAQSDLFGDVEQEQVDQWVEEVVADNIGMETVRKWHY